MNSTKETIYEAHPKGLTMLNYNIPAEMRGKFLGICHPWMVAHMKQLGVSAIQLMPVFNSLETYWGYDPISWTEVNPEYGTLAEFKEMVQVLQASGIKVVLDVVYNHTAGHIDGAKYYDWDATGCGNTVDVKASLPAIMKSINYWLNTVGVDGMRFDLANVMGREGGDFNPNAQFFKEMEQFDDKLLIAEPWDCSEYSLGRFPPNWLELNGKFRDITRAGYEYADGSHLPVERTVNFITCHDGFTLEDMVTYSQKHNHCNGEGNRDGCNNNMSHNFGAEGQTKDKAILARRELHKEWLMNQLMSSKGHKLILAGDEVGNTQFGNNNAYCQDNPLGWIIWN